jgi:hypothetical protein
MFDYLDRLIEKAHEVMGKTLTTKERKKLKESTFCGPNRSFPVPDCAHVRAAKVYLGRSKFSQATKKKIAACINRKAKALGCEGDKPAKADLMEELANYSYAKLCKDEKVIYSSDIFETTKELVNKSLRSPDMELFEDTECKTDETECKTCEDKGV